MTLYCIFLLVCSEDKITRECWYYWSPKRPVSDVLGYLLNLTKIVVDTLQLGEITAFDVAPVGNLALVVSILELIF